MERTVTVAGKAQTVKVDQSSRLSFSAKGEYAGRMVFGHGPTAAAAVAKWAAAARSAAPTRG
jgi:hypothetical protein